MADGDDETTERADNDSADDAARDEGADPTTDSPDENGTAEPDEGDATDGPGDEGGSATDDASGPSDERDDAPDDADGKAAERAEGDETGGDDTDGEDVEELNGKEDGESGGEEGEDAKSDRETTDADESDGTDSDTARNVDGDTVENEEGANGVGDADGSGGSPQVQADGSAAVDSVESQGVFEGAPDDEEMPLTEHIEEMLKRLAAVIVVMGGVSLLIFPIAPDLINWLWYSYLPGSPEACADGASETTACPRVYHPLGLLLARIKVASLVGFVIALPVFVYQTYLFMRPGLYPHERRYYLAAVPTSLVLAFVGLGFAYFLVLPFIFTYFLFYSEDVAEIAFGLTETFDLILLMMGLFAAVFQIPLFIMLAIMMGVTSRDWLEEKRYYFWLGFAGFAFVFSPDPTGMAPFMVGITMVVLYELTLLLLRWTGR